MLSLTRVRLVLSVLFLYLFLVLLLTRSAVSQSAQAAASSPSTQTSSANSTNAQPVASIKATVHHVVVDVVAVDKHGQPVRDLTEKDFEISERVGWVGKVDEKIASFRLVDKTVPVPQGQPRTVVQIPPDSYSNLVATREPDEPLTVILIDELNTDLSKGDVRQQVMKMAASVAGFNVPTSVFVLGNGLRMLQNFNSDGKQLRSTIDTLMKTGPFGGEAAFNLSPSDVLQPSQEMQLQLGVSDSPSILQSGPPSGRGLNGSPGFDPIKDLGKLKSANDRDLSVTTTVDALRALARHLAGYPGRKKLVWVSSAFPFSVLPISNPTTGLDEPISYREEIREATNALADAQVAVYPIQPGGVWMPDVFDVARNGPPKPQDPRNPQSAFGQELTTQSTLHNSTNGTMEEVAAQTGGSPCLGDNDLGFCLKKALMDGYTYYELAYYPPLDTWKDGFHKITVRTTRSGVHLYFRQGYYATPDDSSAQVSTALAERELRQAACEDTLTATSIPLTVVPLGADQSGVVRYSVSVGAHALAGFTDPETNAAAHQLEFAACTFNNDGKPLQFGKIPLEQNLGDAAKQDVFQRIFAFNTDPHATQIRWLVRDKETGALGSVDLPYQSAAPAPKPDNASTSAALANLQQKMAPVVLESEKPDIPPPDAASQAPQSAPPNAEQLPKLDTDTEIASYCEAVGRPGANADALAKVCGYALSLKSKLPDLLCRRSTREYWRSPLSPSKQQVVTEVAYLGGIEYDSDLISQSKSGYYTFHRLGNTVSGGEFAAVLQGIFLPVSNANFHFEGEQTLDSVPAFVFDYQVERSDNRLYILHVDFVGGGMPTASGYYRGSMIKSTSRTLPGTAMTYPGYRGKIWIAKSTSQILRLERETSDIDPTFPITYASTIIKYSNVELGDGTSFVLSTGADNVTCTAQEGKECAHNLTSFDACHKFKATSRIVTDLPADTK